MQRKSIGLIISVILILLFGFSNYYGYVKHYFKKGLELIDDKADLERPLTDDAQGLYPNAFDRQSREREQNSRSDR